MPNRLAEATSPYLRQHADNPVDWMPWGEEAFARAKREGKPVFLSVGYSSCHWCHVMAHESFEDAEVARKLNGEFVSVKVDREERPDVDEAYMAFVQMATGRGGWPMSVFLTPGREPFYGGTYWPREDRGGHPGFLRVLESIAGAWRERRSEVETEADRLRVELTRYFATGSPDPVGSLSTDLYRAALQAQVESFDPERGGFGAAPKFPPHTAIDMLLAYALSEFAADEERQAAIAMAFVSLEAMVMGGIHDWVGGGFHRYSTDAEWLLPHFEKMLYDNALMLGNLARASLIASEIDPARGVLFARAAGGIADWLGREMTSPEGLFYSALDADSPDEHGHPEEGAYYVWDYDDLPSGLAEAFRARPDGNFRDESSGQATGKNILHLREDVGSQFDDELDLLLLKRAERPRPSLDDKVIVGWNGLMIGALAEAGLAEPARRAADSLIEIFAAEGKVAHTIVGGKPQGEAFLEDAAALADGFFKLGALLHQDESDSGDRYSNYAVALGRGMIEAFEDPETGGYFSTSESHETLFGRTRSTFDAPLPSGNALALRVLVAMGEAERARRLVVAVLGTMERAPTATEGLYSAALPLVEKESPSRVLASSPGEIGVTLLSKEVRVDGEGRATLVVSIDLPEGVHINGPAPSERWLTPTRVEVRPLRSEAHYPAEENGYRDRVEIPFDVRLPSGESGADLEVVVTLQPCTERECQPSVERTLSAIIYR